MEINKIKTIAKFMGMKYSQINITDWNFAMMVVEKIESIIENKIEIHHAVTISWSYSPKKTGTFGKGAGGGGGETVKRTPFESIFGKFHQIHCYYYDEIKFKTKKDEVAKSKIDAVLLACFRWIDWYNRTVIGVVERKSTHRSNVESTSKQLNYLYNLEGKSISAFSNLAKKFFEQNKKDNIKKQIKN